MRRSLAAAALMASLINPWSRVLDSLWSFFGAFGNTTVTKEGGGWDPFGRHCLPGALPLSDGGCGMDPFGRCLPAAPPSSDAGAGWDPNG